MYLFFDTETNGLPNFTRSPLDASQPRVTQIAALLLDKDKNIRGELNFLLRLPEGAEIPSKITELTGITEEMCDEYGLDTVTAFDAFTSFVQSAEFIIAHNIKFDRFLLDAVLRHFPEKTYQCTMEMALPIVKLPPTDKMRAAGRFGYKQPKLQEAYKHFFGTEFQKAHDAMADVKACAEVYFKLMEGKLDGRTEVSAVAG